MFRLKAILVTLSLVCTVALAQTKSPDEIAREEAIAEFTKKQQAANWPEKFARIGNEMGVPGDVLAAIAFAETRWEHLKWPAGETTSPENGAPRGYGVMFLQDNDHFGHSLVEAAKLIGKTPDELKDDPELNIRGAAALLKKLYADNPKPDFAKPEQIESWYNAVIKYCGIPQPFLSHSHALNCYVYMSKGYSEYGMYWTPHAVDLKPMREDVMKLRKEFDEAIKRKQTTNVVVDEVQPPTVTNVVVTTTKAASVLTNVAVIEEVQGQRTRVGFNLWLWLGIGAAVSAIALLLLARKKSERR
ncbi:MAG: hypothetical protein ACXWBP_07725 [Limisphaerales bacterium]